MLGNNKEELTKYAIEKGLMNNPTMYYKTKCLEKDEIIANLQKQLEERSECAKKDEIIANLQKQLEESNQITKKWMEYSILIERNYYENQKNWEKYVLDMKNYHEHEKKPIQNLIPQEIYKCQDNFSKEKKPIKKLIPPGFYKTKTLSQC